MSTEVLLLQRAVGRDAESIARLYVASRSEAMPYVPAAHTYDEILGWIRKAVLPRDEVWVARLNASVVGFVALSGDELSQLYVLPGYYRRGIGRRLVEMAKQARPARLFLFTFQRNHRARQFYESLGFRAVELTDGRGNEEQEPDVRYEWVPNTAEESLKARDSDRR